MKTRGFTITLLGFATLATASAGAQTPPNADLQFAIPGTQRAPDQLYDPTGGAPTARLPPTVPDGPPPQGVTTQPLSDPSRPPGPPHLPGGPPAFPGPR